MEDLGADPVATETFPDGLAYLNEEPKPEPKSEPSDPMSLLDTLTESSAPQEPPSIGATPADSLYADSSYAEPPSSVRVYADHAYSNQSNTDALPPTPARPVYDWPSTFARETTDKPMSDHPTAGTRVSAAYLALQPQPLAPLSTPQDSTPDTVDETPLPLAEEDPDVPSVLERLENVRSAIAALMDEVNEKSVQQPPPSSRE
jgi:hypothetical protein